MRRFERIAEAAEKYNVRLALENSAFAQQVHFVLQNIKSDHIGFCYDSGHEKAFTPEENYLSDYADRLFAMHLHDNDGVHDNHFVPFHSKGTINWQEKAAALKNTALGREYIILEAVRQSGSMEEFLQQAYDSAVKLRAL